MTTQTDAKFSLDNLDVFMRPGASIEPRDGKSHAGCWVTLANGWVLSIQWGRMNYSDNYDGDFDEKPKDSSTAEIAVWHSDEGRQGMVGWGEGEWADEIQAYVSMERVQHILDLLHNGTLVQPYTPPPAPPPEPTTRAVDGWDDDANRPALSREES